ncbi:MAG: V-type ATP synthase subunit E [Actinomycetota bacterium]|nr:V-type ATP synthase subunit E [Actinomycetota bacterium]
MPIEKIIERIKSDAEKDASYIRDEAKAKADEILESAGREAESIKSKILATAQAQAEEEKKRILSLARLESRNSILSQKQDAVGSAFKGALDKLLSLPSKEYQELLKKMIVNAATTGEEEIILSPRDRERITNNFVEEVNSILVKQGKKGNLKLAEETRDIRGGFILRSDKIEANNSFPALLETLREEIEPQVLKILFGEVESSRLKGEGRGAKGRR